MRLKEEPWVDSFLSEIPRKFLGLLAETLPSEVLAQMHHSRTNLLYDTVLEFPKFTIIKWLCITLHCAGILPPSLFCYIKLVSSSKEAILTFGGARGVLAPLIWSM